MPTLCFKKVNHIVTHRYQAFAYDSQQRCQPKQKSLGIKDVLYYEIYPSCIAAWSFFILSQLLWIICKTLMSVC